MRTREEITANINQAIELIGADAYKVVNTINLEVLSDIRDLLNKQE